MAQNYAEYLAMKVLNEGQIISYRSLSRALKVRSNRAKQYVAFNAIVASLLKAALECYTISTASRMQRNQVAFMRYT
ncbi:hypothetical protein LTR66_008652 [Elasticomyces elasticus]|nr:hypothetical protein LTR66_008652 [Elasticomyces elasticus]